MRTLLRSVLLAAVAWWSAGAALAQDNFPTRPIRLIVPYAPGGATDFVARLVADKAKVLLGQGIVIDNKPGANGIIGLEELARAKPDGYTLLIGNVTTNAVTPVVLKSKMSINYERDIIGVARLMVAHNVFVVTTKEFEPKTFAEFVAYAKKNPGKVRYATNGIGSFLHYDTELAARRAGIELNHIPYKSVTDMMKGLLSGEVQAAFISTPITIPQAANGAVRVLANVERRLAPFPDAPTLAELGIKDVGTGNWQAVFAPAGTPPAVLEKLHKALIEASQDPAVVKAAAGTGTDLDLSTSPAETQKWLNDEVAKWRRIVEEVKIDLN